MSQVRVLRSTQAVGMASGMAPVSTRDRTHPLLAARVAVGLSRERLAALAGVSPRTIYAVELEAVQPQRATRYVIAQALGTDVNDLFDDEGPVATRAPRTTSDAGSGDARDGSG